MEQAYAEALWKLTANGMSPAHAVRSLAEVLQQHGRIALFPRISRAFARIAERRLQNETMRLSVAREKDERSARSAAKAVLAELNVEAKDLTVTVDDSLIGGWRLEGGETLIDRSYKSRLLEVFNKAVSA